MDASKKATVMMVGRDIAHKFHYEHCNIVDFDKLVCCAAMGCKKKLYSICMQIMHSYKAWFEDMDISCLITCLHREIQGMLMIKISSTSSYIKAIHYQVYIIFFISDSSHQTQFLDLIWEKIKN